MQRHFDHAFAATKELVKTFTYEFLNNVARFINGVSALLLAIFLGRSNVLEGSQGWELRPKFHGPRFPRWMGNGGSSFNKFIHELSVDSDPSYIDYSYGEDNFDGIYPASPSSIGSRTSRTSTFITDDWHWTSWMAYIFSWLFLPAKIFLVIPFLFFRLFNILGSRASLDPRITSPSKIDPFRKAHTSKDHVVHRTIDKRRGVVEDLHLAIEVFIEAVFDVFHKATQFVLSPSVAFKFFGLWFSFPSDSVKDINDDDLNVSVPTATLDDTDPAPTKRNLSFHHALNTDARTCQDFITELGYPYEAIHVVTADGYILLLERIPRRDSRKVAFLQHGTFDSSLGWVSNGVVGSPAFAAFDQGYDVFLGNYRGLVSREHVDKNISLQQYWRFSVNELGTKDIPALVEKIHEVKTAELKISQPNEETNEQPYKICAISHSLGGGVMLMYVVTRRVEEKPHRLSRLVLLSTAGFHDDSIFIFSVGQYLFPLLYPFLKKIVPALYIPTRFFRMLCNKLARDFHNYPAVGGLVQTLLSCFFGGDSSNWVGVMGLTHYNMNDMPGLSLRVCHHLAQVKRKGKFRMYDYGSASANMEVYGSPEPLDLGENYSLIDIPIDLVAGRRDQVIRASMIIKHYNLMKDAGVDVSYKEFMYGHLDFTKSHNEELLAYLMSRMLLVEPALKHSSSSSQKALKLKKKEQAIASS